MKKYVLGLGALVLAFAILFISVFQSAAIDYVFATPTPTSSPVLGKSVPEIDYQMPFPGRILPDNPLWAFKAVRDRIWYLTTQNHLKKAELALLFSDKRLEASSILFKNGKPDIALSTLTKGEKYLEIASRDEFLAREKGENTNSFLIKLTNSALKHRQIIENELIHLTPEDARPDVVKAENYAKDTYKSSRDALNGLGLPVPESPFSGD
jgi:hypothetical protein